MGALRIPNSIWQDTYRHLFDAPGEHFAFYMAQWTFSQGEPVFMVRDVLLIPDDALIPEGYEMVLSLEALLGVINTAVRSGDCLVEIHNHGGTRPRFSSTDREGLRAFPSYVHSSLPGRPYAATVWGDTTVYGEFFLPTGRTGRIESIMVCGEQVRQIVSRDDDYRPIGEIANRQLPWFTPEGQRQLSRLRIGIVGAGGTGAQAAQNLAYLGCQEFVLVDNDLLEESNLNRVVTGTPADIGTPKVDLAQRLIQTLDPQARVLPLELPLQSKKALDALKGVDILFGCVDNDGARLILNELALAYSIPYIDVGVGIDAKNGTVSTAGGRVAVVLPGGPCLNCMGQIDSREAAFFLASPEEQVTQIRRGYVTGMNVHAPAVVTLNAIMVAVAINEFAVLVSGLRPPTPLIEYDLLGSGRATKSQWLTPSRVKQEAACIECTLAGIGDRAGLIERYDSSDAGYAAAA